MSKREIASLACKILGMYLIFQGINFMANVLSVSFVTPGQLEPRSAINIAFPYISPIIFGVLLWFLSDKLSSIMVKGETLHKEGLGIKAGDIQRILFSVLGLLFMGNSLPKLVTTLTSMYSTRDVANMTLRLLPGAVGGITQILLGAGVFLGSRGLVNLLNVVRYTGLTREDDSSEEG
ncbi:MAG: hypothetical protein P4L59_12485 [Desulfosporosinus sp.]|nr:hypothetical protein [Desulfosporosinus sp.]